MKLTCSELNPFIDAYIDDEFDTRERVEFEAHIGECETCRAEVEFQIQFKQHLRETLSTERAPQSLRDSILVALEQEQQRMHVAAAEHAASLPRARHGRIARRAGLVAAPIAAILCAAFVLPAFTIATASSTQLPVIEQSVDWHRGDLPMEIRDSDAADISNWFVGKVDFPVRLPPFPASSRATLIGARIANVQDRRAAYVLYDVDGARMSMLVFPGDGVQVPSDKVTKLAGHDVVLTNAHGYDVAVMQSQGVTYSMTSELRHDQFVSLMQQALAR